MAVGAGAAYLVLAAASVLPVQEIAQVLERRQIDPPPAAELGRLSGDEFQAYLSRYDPYARYLGPEDYRSLQAGDRERVGVGVHLYRSDAAWLMQPIPGGPAWRAGLRTDARLISVDGEGVNGHDAEWLGQRIEGPEDSALLLVVEAADGAKQALQVLRQPFRSPTLSYLEQDGLAYIRLWDFRRRETLDALRRALKRLPADQGPAIIDLRQASGGDLFEALDSTSLFLPQGLSLAAIEDNRGSRREFRSLAGRALQRPLLLLVGRGTASAAESFALALRHHGAAVLVGGRSHGKCLTQTIAPLSNGGAIRFSNGRLWGPEGVPCDSDGLRPDVPVPRADSRSVRDLAEAGQRLLDARDPRQPFADLRP
jgi:carboxyl-terminal processing protease